MFKKEKTVRPLARVLARELTQEELVQVAAATCYDGESTIPSTGGNSYDCTTGGVSPSDRDVLQ